MLITIDAPDDVQDVLGDERVRAIVEALATHAAAQFYTSYNLAVTGAMRWPASMRPEAMVMGYVRAV